MSLFSDLKILYHLALHPVRGSDHGERMENFYAGQADAYDEFRKRLLQGREELYRSIDVPTGGVWVDLGGGTGANMEFIADRIPQLRKAYVVDLSPSLLQVASARFSQLGWDHVEPIAADATQWQPPERQVDVVTFSYSLTMIPDWFGAIDNALRMLKPGGILAAVDFYVSRKYASFPGAARHGWFTRTFWPAWFAMDNVFLSGDHLPYLLSRTELLRLHEHRAKVPYIPLIRVPYYQFVGRKLSD
ncbi:MAG: ubiquinone/menaquinone biosynthesis methyltransferase [Pirellulaceae bacterium]|nr:MAG: ubiquinone/menaquinone biosynthesis methyltransferase [Pirellulaceae bacterium]